MPLPEATNWFQDKYVEAIGGNLDSFVIVGLVIAPAGWIIGKAVGGIVSEYAKRFWFREVHRDALRKGLDDLSKARAVLAEQQKETETFVSSAERLVEVNHTLFDQNIKNKAQIVRLTADIKRLEHALLLCKRTEDGNESATDQASSQLGLYKSTFDMDDTGSSH